ncbi:MAG: hypothetical protein P0Y58_21670 [Candidatus Pseudomonas phytovorans]|uniref:Uncharacterized protein n=1 Tax=Candidatus Pseudomonas phytovorans TaxID=3121377 RepID=A0AAJ5WGT7_9PSED|nr:hypothetical protein [Pseudomonas sp.]WEK29489.1 MAG: hypothetical protein P0Y58_21670 [Pseudomonas sp.]
MDHVGFALTIASLVMGALCGLYRQYVIMLVTAFILGALVAQGEAAHHWMSTLSGTLLPALVWSVPAAHLGFFVTRWIPALLSRTRQKPDTATPGQDQWKTLG